MRAMLRKLSNPEKNPLSVNGRDNVSRNEDVSSDFGMAARPPGQVACDTTRPHKDTCSIDLAASTLRIGVATMSPNQPTGGRNGNPKLARVALNDPSATR